MKKSGSAESLVSFIELRSSKEVGISIDVEEAWELLESKSGSAVAFSEELWATIDTERELRLRVARVGVFDLDALGERLVDGQLLGLRSEIRSETLTIDDSAAVFVDKNGLESRDLLREKLCRFSGIRGGEGGCRRYAGAEVSIKDRRLTVGSELDGSSEGNTAVSFDCLL